MSATGHTNFILSYENGANFDGTQTLREALDDVAEATQTIYFLDANNKLCFKQLDKSGNAVISIDISASVATIVEKQSDIDSTIVDMQKGIGEQNQSNAAQFETLTNKVNATMTSEQVQLAISTEVAKGASKVTTSTGFKFDDSGLTISKTNSEMSTTIDEDGMSIFKGSEEVLTADNTGVDAKNLHATTYLIIGTNSRFEDYGSRTGCFWIRS